MIDNLNGVIQVYPLRKSGLLVHTNGSEIGDAFTFILALKVDMCGPKTSIDQEMNFSVVIAMDT